MNADEPLLKDTGRGCTVFYRGKNLYSASEPREAARRRAAAVSLQDRSLVLVPGLGLGYGLEVLLARLPAGSRLVAVETDPKLYALAASFSPPRDPRLTLCATRESAVAAARELGLYRFRRVQVAGLCGSYQLDRAGYDALLQSLEEEIRLFWQNRITLAHMSRLWLRNLFTNLVTLSSGGEAPAPQERGDNRLLPRDSRLSPPGALGGARPILVAGAGPSLEAALPRIARVRDRLTLLAVDTALPVLAEAGLAPDWVYALEGQHYNLEDFLPFRDPALTLLCDLSSCPSVIRLFPRRQAFATRFHPLALFDRLSAAGLLPPELPPLGSVGVTAVRAALSLTAGPVLLAGLDFCYPGGRTHARGAPAHRRFLSACFRLVPVGMRGFEALAARPRLRVAGKGGRRYSSDLVLSSYALQLFALARQSGRLYDLGVEGLETGAKLLRSDEELDSLLAEGPWASAPALRPFHPQPAQVRGFLLREAALLREAEQELEAALRQGSAPGSAVAAAGYVLLATPEADPERLKDRGNLALALANARWLRARLQRLA
jgi:hypothetical protein